MTRHSEEKSHSSQVELAPAPSDLAAHLSFSTWIQTHWLHPIPQHARCVSAPGRTSVREQGQDLNPGNARAKSGTEKNTINHQKRRMAWCYEGKPETPKANSGSWTWQLHEGKANRNKDQLKEGKEGRKERRTKGRNRWELFTANSLGSQSRETTAQGLLLPTMPTGLQHQKQAHSQ